MDCKTVDDYNYKMVEDGEDLVSLADYVMDVSLVFAEKKRSKKIGKNVRDRIKRVEKSLDLLYKYLDTLAYDDGGPVTVTRRSVGRTLVCDKCGENGFFMDKELDLHTFEKHTQKIEKGKDDTQ